MTSEYKIGNKKPTYKLFLLLLKIIKSRNINPPTLLQKPPTIKCCLSNLNKLSKLLDELDINPNIHQCIYKKITQRFADESKYNLNSPKTFKDICLEE